MPEYRIEEGVSIRDESFGGLAYSFNTRRLSLIKSRAALEIARLLDRGLSAADVAAWIGPEHRLSPAEVRQVAARLVEAGVLVEGPAQRDRHEAHAAVSPAPGGGESQPIVERYGLDRGLRAPICLTWELTYACNLACIHCLSSSGRRDPRELSTGECEGVIDDLSAMKVFYINVGGGEPTLRPDFWHLIDYASAVRLGMKFSSNGSRITQEVADRIRRLPYVDVQVSVDGADAATNDAIRGTGSFAVAVRAMDRLAAAGVAGFKLSVVVTRTNVGQLDQLEELANRYGAQLRLTRLRPSGRGARSWDRLHLTQAQQVLLYEWLLRHPDTLTGDSFFHLSALGSRLPGMNLCGAGRVVSLIDPVGDVYACPFVLHERFVAGNVRDQGGFSEIWASAELFRSLRAPDSDGACAACGQFDACRGGCMAAKFFTGLPIDGPDPECVLGNGIERVRAAARPVPTRDHSRLLPVLQ